MLRLFSSIMGLPESAQSPNTCTVYTLPYLLSHAFSHSINNSQCTYSHKQICKLYAIHRRASTRQQRHTFRKYILTFTKYVQKYILRIHLVYYTYTKYLTTTSYSISSRNVLAWWAATTKSLLLQQTKRNLQKKTPTQNRLVSNGR